MFRTLAAAIRWLSFDPDTRITVPDRRCLSSRPFDGTPRRRSDDIGMLIAEHEGTATEFMCRDGRTRAVVRRIDYMEDFHPVKGYVIIPREGLAVHVDNDWLCDGSANVIGKHNWDIIGLAEPDVSDEVAA